MFRNIGLDKIDGLRVNSVTISYFFPICPNRQQHLEIYHVAIFRMELFQLILFRFFPSVNV